MKVEEPLRLVEIEPNHFRLAGQFETTFIFEDGGLKSVILDTKHIGDPGEN